MSLSTIGEKALAIEKRRADVQLLAHAIDRADKGAFVDVEELRAQYVEDAAHEARVAGCGGVLDQFARLLSGRHRVALDEAAPTSTTSKLASVFKRTSAAEKMSAALESVVERKQELARRVDEARAKASTMHASGRKREALMALKRAKQLEQQLQGVAAAEISLEQQLVASESVSLNREVSEAMASSLKTAKKRSKGLLGRTEQAVEDGEELRDFSEELGQLLGGSVGGDFDEDDLMSELEAMGSAEPVKVDVAEEDATPSADWQPISLPVPTKAPEVGVGAM